MHPWLRTHLPTPVVVDGDRRQIGRKSSDSHQVNTLHPSSFTNASAVVLRLGLIYFCSLVRLACLLISSQDFSNGFSRSHLRLGEKSTKKAPVWKLVCSASNICLLILDPTYVLRLKCQEYNSVLGNSEFSCNDLKFFKHPKIFIFDESNTCNNDWNSSLFQEINILNF